MPAVNFCLNDFSSTAAFHRPNSFSRSYSSSEDAYPHNFGNRSSPCFSFSVPPAPAKDANAPPSTRPYSSFRKRLRCGWNQPRIGGMVSERYFVGSLNTKSTSHKMRSGSLWSRTRTCACRIGFLNTMKGCLYSLKIPPGTAFPHSLQVFAAHFFSSPTLLYSTRFCSRKSGVVPRPWYFQYFLPSVSPYGLLKPSLFPCQSPYSFRHLLSTSEPGL
mmetsp:Transcript_27391/g.69074  ORF Transcript_27391/g.69074 Transcript_27391/m.69074 type:complete len:217 (-) Transcript_27391:1382-2032(-)